MPKPFSLCMFRQVQKRLFIAKKPGFIHHYFFDETRPFGFRYLQMSPITFGIIKRQNLAPLLNSQMEHRILQELRAESRISLQTLTNLSEKFHAGDNAAGKSCSL